jgi:hypothetical protein
VTDDHRNIRTALDEEEARRVDDDYLSELQRVWQAASKGPWYWSGAREFDDSASDLKSADGDYVLAHDRAAIGVKRADADAIARAPEHIAALLAEVNRLRAEASPDDGRIPLRLTHDQIAMVHHALANLGNTDPLKADAFRELFAMVSAHVQPRR